MTHDRAGPNCTNRLFEWIAALIMFQIGLVVIGAEIAFGKEPSATSLRLAFEALGEIGLSTLGSGIMFFILGAGRMIALKLNGDWVIGPHVRVICAIMGMFIWSQLLYGIFHIWWKSGDVYYSVAVWDSLLIGEYLSIKRAVLDIHSKPRSRKGNA